MCVCVSVFVGCCVCMIMCVDRCVCGVCTCYADEGVHYCVYCYVGVCLTVCAVCV